MTEQEFFDALNRVLWDCDSAYRAEIVEDFQQHFADAHADGKTDKAIIASFGNLEEMLEELREGNMKTKKNAPIPTDSKADSNEIQEVHVYAGFADVEILQSTDDFVSYECDGDPLESDDYVVEESRLNGILSIHVRRKQMKWKRSFFATELLKLIVYVPDGLQTIETYTTHGEILCDGRTAANVHFTTISGDITLKDSMSDSVTIETKSGDLELSGEYGTMQIHTTNGDIHCDAQSIANLQLTTKSGDLELFGKYGTIQLSTTNGDIRYEASCDHLEIETESGDMNLEGTASKVRIQATSGDVEMKLDQLAKLDIQTTSGDIEIETEEGFWLQFDTSSGDLDLDVESIKKMDDSNYVCGFGIQVFAIRTDSGDVEIHN